MSTLAINLRWSKIRGIISRPEMYNSQTRKKPEQAQIIQIEFSINSNKKGLKYKLILKPLDISEIKGSTHTIY